MSSTATQCGFKSVLEALRETAFIASELPVMLSLEMHCSASQQQRCAQYREVFGETLLLPEDVATMIRKAPLTRKILIKGKMSKPHSQRRSLALQPCWPARRMSITRRKRRTMMRMTRVRTSSIHPSPREGSEVSVAASSSDVAERPHQSQSV